MNIEKYTERARGFIQSAQSLATREGHQQFTALQMLKVLLDDSEGLAGGLIDRSGGNSRAVLKATEDALNKLPKVSGSGAGQVYLAPELARAFDAAEEAAEKAGDNFVTVERLLLGLTLEKDSDAGSILRKGGVTPQNLNAAIEALRKGRTADSATAENAYDALKKYARDREELWPDYKQMRDRTGAERGWPPMTRAEFDGEADQGSFYVGSPETVARKIAATANALGLERFDLKYSAGPLPHENLMRSIELYGKALIPLVRKLLSANGLNPRRPREARAISVSTCNVGNSFKYHFTAELNASRANQVTISNTRR